jgi:hypothetical protein
MAAPLSAQVVDNNRDPAQNGAPSISNDMSELEGRALPSDLQPGDIVHIVRPSESPAYLGELYFGDPNAWQQIYADNRDRPQPDGDTLRDAGMIRPDWVIVIHQPTRMIEYDADGQAWHVVRRGESLWAITDSLTGDGRQ